MRCAEQPVRGAEMPPPLCVGACHTQVTLSVRDYLPPDYCRSATGDGCRHTERLYACVCARARHVGEWRLVDGCGKITQHGLTTEGCSLGAGPRGVSVLTQRVHQVHVPLPSVLPRATHAYASPADACNSCVRCVSKCSSRYVRAHRLQVHAACLHFVRSAGNHTGIVACRQAPGKACLADANYLRTPHSSGRARRTVARPFATSIKCATPISKRLHVLTPHSPPRWRPWARTVHLGCILHLSGQGFQALRRGRQSSELRR